MCLVSMLAGVLLKNLLPVGNILGFVIAIIIYSIIYILTMWLFGINRFEKDLIYQPLEKIGRKLCMK